MNKSLKLLAFSVSMAFGAAHAGVIVTDTSGSQTSSFPGACTVTFNSGNATNTCGATYTGTTAGNFVTGSLSGQYAAPVNDATTYLSVGPSSGSQSVTISLANSANYFGFYTGSLDAFNLVQFYMNGTLIDSFTGDQINAKAFGTSNATGNQSQAAYVNYFTTNSSGQVLFNKVVYSSTQNAFETDNHSFGVAAIPEPGSLALVGVAGLGLLLSRRRKQG